MTAAREDGYSFDEWLRPIGAGLTRDGKFALVSADEGYMWQKFRGVSIEDKSVIKDLSDKKGFTALLGKDAKIVYEVPFSGTGMGNVLQQYDFATKGTQDLGHGTAWYVDPTGSTLIYGYNGRVRRLPL